MEQRAPKRSSLGLAFLAALVVGGSAVGVMIYQLMQKEKPPADTSGFDISQTHENRNASGGSAGPIGPTPAQSGLGMLKTGSMGKMSFGEGGGSQTNAPRKTAESFIAAVKKCEGKVQALAISYTKRYPIVAQYGRDWMGYPDLKKLNDDYMRDHDSVKFMHGLAQSQNFGKMVDKYAGSPVIQSFVKEGVKQAPGELPSAAMDLLKDDGLIKNLVANTASALGLPPALTANLLGGSKVDEKQVMGQVLQGNPDLQKAMQDPNVQKTLQSPEAQKILQQQGGDPNRRP